jgi:hypothetical protein
LIISLVSVFLIVIFESPEMQLKLPPRIALEEVELAKTLDPFSKTIDPLFHSSTPCCNQRGRNSYAIFNLPSNSRAVVSLFAKRATLML